MHAPGPWSFVLLVLAVYRLTRLIGWDDWPPAARLRGKVIGETWTTEQAWTHPGWWRGGVPDVELPGKTPESPAEGVRPGYRRPTLAHLVHCPFCLGWWVALAAYAAWLATPHWTLIVLAPFAIAGAGSLIGKNLDAS